MKSARDIFYSYPKLPVDEPMPMYVEMGEYEAMVSNSAEKVNLITQETDELKAILKQWLDIGPTLPFGEWNPEELNQVVAATKAILGK